LAERRPHVEEEAGYQSVLVTFENGHYASSVVRTAVRLAARRRHGIHVLVTITVPTT
jgi:K+-sensing histidine kinase KdpD